MFLNTEDRSSAVDGIILPLTSRRVQVAWISGSVAAYQVRRRDQLRLLWCEITARPSVSFGRFCNWAKRENELYGVAAL